MVFHNSSIEINGVWDNITMTDVPKIIKVTEYRQLCKLKAHNEIHFVVLRNSIMISTLQTFNVIDIQCCNCCRHSMLQMFDVAIRR